MDAARGAVRRSRCMGSKAPVSVSPVPPRERPAQADVPTLLRLRESVRPSILIHHPRLPAAVLLAALAACGGKENRGRGTAPQFGGHGAPLASAITDTTEDGQWTMPAHDYASTRYSRLAQITTTNVANL